MSWRDAVADPRVEFPAIVEDDWKTYDPNQPIKRWIIRLAHDASAAVIIPKFPYQIQGGILQVDSFLLYGGYLSRLNVPPPGQVHGSKTEIAFPINPIEYDKFDVQTGWAGVEIHLLPKGGASVIVDHVADSKKLDEILSIVKQLLAGK